MRSFYASDVNARIKSVISGGLKMQGMQRMPRLDGEDVEKKRLEILNYFLSTFDRYEILFETLSCEEAYFVKPIFLRHPLIFYLGHTATFFINKLVLANLIRERINPQFESVFAVGVDEMSWDDLDDAHYDWPQVSEVMAYRKRVREIVSNLIETLPLALPIGWDHPWWAILMAIEHERIHLETSSVLIRQHAIQYVKPHPSWHACDRYGKAPKNELVDVPAGEVVVGKRRDAMTYGWDNEYGSHSAFLPAFKASRYLVSNQEFLEFVECEGYSEDSCWDQEGLAWRNYAKAKHPTFWIENIDGWHLRLMTEVVPMRWDWPVEVNFHEANAFCNWKKAQTGKPIRLPTEDEWFKMYDCCKLEGIEEGRPANANIHLDLYASPCPVNEFRHGEFYDVRGNVWQWTGTPIYPFEGFEVHPLYDDFTTPTYDGRHNLIKGGSWISCGNEALRSARYAFRRHFFQHAGFRYVEGKAAISPVSSNYETDRLLSEYAEFHYGEEYFNVPNFPKTLAMIAIEAMGKRPMRRALDLGCAAGRASFELARHFERVTGVDFSARFIGVGVELAKSGTLRYQLAEEGSLVSYKSRTLKELGLEGLRDKVEFFQGDACNLKPIFCNYDLILAANLIDRLYSPAKFLSGVHERLNIGGILMIASPYTWLEEHTKRSEWIGGFKKDGESHTTLEGLKELLSPHFRMMGKPQDVPFVIRETRRKFQHSLSEITLWERIS